MKLNLGEAIQSSNNDSANNTGVTDIMKRLGAQEGDDDFKMSQSALIEAVKEASRLKGIKALGAILRAA